MSSDAATVLPEKTAFDTSQRFAIVAKRRSTSSRCIWSRAAASFASLSRRPESWASDQREISWACSLSVCPDRSATRETRAARAIAAVESVAPTRRARREREKRVARHGLSGAPPRSASSRLARSDVAKARKSEAAASRVATL